jgi:hypothetical protein
MNPESSLPSPDHAIPEQSLSDARMSWLGLLANVLMIPLGLLLLVPLAILVALWFYLIACKEGTRLLFRAMVRRRNQDAAVRVLRAPHFSEGHVPSPTKSDD